MADCGRKSAVRLYESFRGREPERFGKFGVKYGSVWLTDAARINLIIPAGLAVVGNVYAIEYDTTRDHKTVLARHEFEKGSRPLFAVGAKPGELFLIGNRYKFTDRGIIDLDPTGRMREGGLDK